MTNEEREAWEDVKYIISRCRSVNDLRFLHELAELLLKYDITFGKAAEQ